MFKKGRLRMSLQKYNIIKTEIDYPSSFFKISIIFFSNPFNLI
jgi:hypothetical protein